MTETQSVAPIELRKRAIGPLDKRRNTRRCRSCAKLRVKCEGGPACQRCIRMKTPCELQRVQQRSIQFIHAPKHGLLSATPLQMRRHDDDIYLDHFASFLQRCDFSREFSASTREIMAIIGRYPLLSNIAIAIGALDTSRRGSIRSFTGTKSPRNIAFLRCGISLKYLDAEISTITSVFREDVFWSTFLHGLFELIAENSGDSFATHMTYGLSRMILLLQPADPLSIPTKSLIDVFWLLEANRLIIYGDDTLISPLECPWRSYRDNWPIAMKNIITLMIQAATFAQRLFTRIESIPEEGRCFDPSLDCLAKEGIEIKAAILNCKEISNLEEMHKDDYTRLAVIMHGALLLYHCRNFTFYSCWEMRETPQLDQREIDTEVTMILSQSQILLSNTEIPGVLLLFPLRMAGTLVKSSTLQGKILDILYQIRRKGFVISDRIEADLQELWYHEWTTTQPNEMEI
ncbi:hypothetical protein N7481_008797 [Penicillium waksmanii]|uniref:uncharacterized protein n=1 Tax=Penicillium waksmanii TaxID=69791 RepID=UPI002549BF3C|nr:uncharacterized protein N7481_008797 [Penicillium waksmanii]KAJ5975090.1 hypothetical protein N7481_008797 [Penicillium waksmanii]